VDKDDVFTTDPKSTWVHLLPWGTLGEAFPFFKPNYTKMAEYGKDMGADEVGNHFIFNLQLDFDR